VGRGGQQGPSVRFWPTDVAGGLVLRTAGLAVICSRLPLDRIFSAPTGGEVSHGPTATSAPDGRKDGASGLLVQRACHFGYAEVVAQHRASM
jgi:hypothetical protein